MNNIEFSNNFDTLVSSYSINNNLNNTLSFDEYEKSLFLTKAQNEIITSLYTGKNANNDSFESSEEIRQYLLPLIKDVTKSTPNDLVQNTTNNIINFGGYKMYNTTKLDDNIIGIIYQEATFNDTTLSCYNNTTIGVIPIRHDELLYTLKDPFRCPNKNRILRIDFNNNIIQLISKYNLSKTYIRYLVKPNPIILVDLDDGLTIDGKTEKSSTNLPNILHDKILNRAVELAIQSKIKYNNVQQ